MRFTRPLRSILRRSATWRALLAAALSAAALTACSATSPPGTIQGALTGIGNTSQQSLVAAWAKGWKSENPASSIAYSPDGTEAGKKALFEGQAYFAAGPKPLTFDEASNPQTQCGPKGAISIPTGVIPVGIAYNLESVRSLKLDAESLKKIFAGEIRKWNDASIKVQNPGVALPAIDVVPILEDGASDSTFALNTYLGQEATGSANGGPSSEWPEGTRGLSKSRVLDRADKLDETPGGISVLERGVIGARFSTADLKFGSVYHPFTGESALASIKSGETVVNAGVGVEQRMNGERGYSLAIVEYQYFCSQYKNAAIADLVQSWGRSVLSIAGQKAANLHVNALAPSEATVEASLELIGKVGSEGE